MRIPLDYYRILGIFPQATDEQLRQAYRDRSVQLPRREYSDLAIEARRQLLEQAYSVLSNPTQKAKYENQFLQAQFAYQEQEGAESSATETEAIRESSSVTTWEIEVEPEQLPGSLLIFHELGEYELVINYGESYLSTLPTSPLSLNIDDTATKQRSDTFLSIALAYLEISREQWHQQAYEGADSAGRQGLTLLEKNNLFPSIQTEIRTELHKLRPYQILELLALPLKNKTPRQTGIKLLQSMLEERQGIDGKGDDGSGLGIDDFLRFIQQIRTYLTATEQKDIFMEESQRPSSVAAYLGVYALIAQGFAHKQPSLILEAKTVLEGLEPRQDVSIEQSIVALLLGQTEAAAKALKRCQDQQALNFIREKSQGAPDLLPGLCLYGEHWLQTEVFSHCRDLQGRQPSLKDYFADQGVQAYLNRLLTPIAPRPRPVKKKENIQPSRHNTYNHGTAVPVADPFPPLPVRSSSPIDIRDARRRKRLKNSQKPNPEPIPETVSEKSSSNKPASTQTIPNSKPPAKGSPRRNNRRVTLFRPKLGLMAVAVLGGVGLIGLATTWLNQSNAPLSALEEGQYSVALHRPLIDIPAANAQMVTVTGMLTSEGAQQVIETWLGTKSQALGKDHDIESLKKILADPVLTRWQKQAQQLQQNQSYWTYEHQVAVNSFNPSPNNPNQAVVDANVKESAQSYQGSQPGRSYKDNLRVRYDLVRQGDRWLIKGINVIR
ncbi:IMS domain-containing protein [Crocosphaera watsonii]|uniref:J domain-containing protein n=1 Tax=Crocosphaera watsonii WH 0401 TaxID=555881 RepID=T2JGI2_CROWT|nr:IMS domain-containing protein [Crocosphaera watsonii]CCQ63587.1 hypothetical protein CWATWH0401_3376 [Crocosphaera watsonii WH 0401]